MNPQDTPRTAAAVYADMDSFPIKEWVSADFARQLEREVTYWEQRAHGAEDELKTLRDAATQWRIG